MATKQKAVSQYEGKTRVATFASIAVAAELTGAQRAHIGKVANGIRNTASGYVWRNAKGTSKKDQVVLMNDGSVVATFPSIEALSLVTGTSVKEISTRITRKSGLSFGKYRAALVG